ncbi:MAG: hypothetical protein ACRC46_02980 [Thermoguttaceae bacterium]
MKRSYAASSLVVFGLASVVGCTSLGTWNANFLTPPAGQQQGQQQPQKVSMATPNRYAATPPQSSQSKPSSKKSWSNPSTWFTPQVAVAQNESEGFAYSSAMVPPQPYPVQYQQQVMPYYQQEQPHQVAAYQSQSGAPVGVPVNAVVPASPTFVPQMPMQQAPQQVPQQIPMPVQPAQPQPAVAPRTISADLIPKPLPDAVTEESPIALVAYTTSEPDEYIVSGGDAGGRVRVHDDWTVTQLGPEDTVAHFDTVDGKVVVVESERVVLYAPRFRSVRVVEGVQQDAQRVGIVAYAGEVAPQRSERRERTGATSNETQPLYARHDSNLDRFGSRAAPSAARANTMTSADANVEAVMSYSRQLSVRYLDSEAMASLVRGHIKAQAWAGNESVRVRIHQLAAAAVSNEQDAASMFAVENGESRSILRLVKVADRDAAHPGDIVEFTLRFDNMGNKPIGNVTIIDSLTSRLEFVEGSAEASLATGFLTERNGTGSLVLRWEITDPLRPLEYGVIRFKCRVL